MRVATDSELNQKQRAESAEAYEEDRRKKLDRTRHKSVGASVDMVNLFTKLGLAAEYLKDSESAFQIVPSRLEGRLKKLVPEEAYTYLESDFGASTIKVDGYEYIHFEGGKVLSFYTEVAEFSGQKQSVVKEVWKAICKYTRRKIRKERKARLPDLAIVRVDYRPAKPKRKMKNPFKKGEWMLCKAKPASNKLRFRPVKKLKVFVDNKVPVEAPAKKK